MGVGACRPAATPVEIRHAEDQIRIETNVMGTRVDQVALQAQGRASPLGPIGHVVVEADPHANKVQERAGGGGDGGDGIPA